MAADFNRQAAPRRSLARRIGWWLGGLLFALTLVVCAALVTVFSFEQASLRPLIELLVEKATGRALSIDGELDARAGRIVSIRAGGISLANAAWGSSDKMLSIGEAEISVDLLRLLGGMLTIDDLVIRRAQLLFEEDEQGRSNWAMGSGDEQSPSADEREARGALALPIARSQLSDIDITLKSASLPRPVEVHLDSLGHSADQGNELRASVVGAIDNQRLSLQARIGPLAQLLDAGAVDFSLEGDFEAVAFELSGHTDKLLDAHQASLQVSLAAAEISQVLANFGLPQLASGAADLKASLQPAGDHHTLGLAASIGSLTLDAEARLPELDSLDGASITLSAAGPDLAAAARLAGLHGLPSNPFTIASSASLAGTLLTIGDTSFDSGDTHLTASGSMSQFPRLDGTNLKLLLVGKNYLNYAELLGITMLAGLQPEPFEVRANMEYDTQDRQQFTAQLTLADVSGEFSGQLSGDPAFIGSHLDYRLEGRNDALIQRMLGRAIPIEGNYRLQGNLQRTAVGYRIERAALSAGANELEVSGAIGNDPMRADTELSMRFHGPDLDKIVVIAGYDGFLPSGDAEINAEVRAQDNAVQVDALSARLGRNTLKGSGLVSLQPGMAGSRVELALAGTDIAEVLPPDLLYLAYPGQSFELTGTLASASGQLEIDALQARLGEVSLDASGTVSTTQPSADMSLQVDARGPDLAAFVPQQWVPYSLPAAQFSVSGGIAINQKLLTLDAVSALVGPDRLQVSGTIPLDTPSDGLDLVIAASGPDLGAVVPVELEQIDFKALAYEISGNIQLAQGSMSLRQLEFSTPRGRLSGQLGISLENPRHSGQFDLKANGDDLGGFLPAIPGYAAAAVPFNLDARGSWDDKRVSVESGHLQLDDASIEAQGEISLPPEAAATRLVLSASGDSLADLGQFGELRLPAEAFQIDASLQGDANGLHLPALDARVGESDLGGSLQIEFTEKPLIRIDLESDVLDLEELLPVDDNPENDATLPQPQAGDGRLIPQLAVPVDLLNRVNLETRIRVGELRGIYSTMKNVAFDSTLQEGNLTVSQLTATAVEGQINASFKAVADGDRIVTSGNLQGKDIVPGKVQIIDPETAFPRLNLQLEFDTAGATLRELAANLNGYAQFKGGAGRMENDRTLGWFGDFSSELLSTINPFVTREPYTAISCFAGYTEIIKGIAKIKPGAVMQTDKLNMFAIGQLDLNTERISLRFETTARSGIGVSVSDFVNPFVGVGGTLANPRLGMDPGNAMFEGAFAYATIGLSIVGKGLFNRWFSASDPCANFEKEARDYLKSKQDMQDKPISKPPKPAAGDS